MRHHVYNLVLSLFWHVFMVQVYDAEGRLLIAMSATKAIWGGDKGTARPCDMTWQPYLSSTTMPTGESLAALLHGLCLDKRARTPTTTGNHKVLIRVLDCVEKEAQEEDGNSSSVLYALSGLTGLAEAGVVVEVYSATHNQALLDKLSSHCNSLSADTRRWLRPRCAFLPAARSDLRCVAFDVIVIGTSSRASRAALQAWGGADVMMVELRSLACPGALVLLQSAGAESGEDSNEELRQALQAAASEGDTWEVGGTGFAARLTDVGRLEARGSKTLVVSDRSSSMQAFASTEVLLCGPGSDLHDDVSDDAWAAALGPHLDISKAGAGGAVDTIVFLAGLQDHSPLSSLGFYRLVSFFRALSATLHGQGQGSTGPSAGVDVWVVTSGCFSGEQLHIGQASLYAVTRHVEADMVGVTARYADVESLDCLPRLASLIEGRPVERNFRLLQQQQVPLVQRYFAVEDDELNVREVLANDSKLAYRVEVLSVKEDPVPGQVSTGSRRSSRPGASG
jgi:hypothetical protein